MGKKNIQRGLLLFLILVAVNAYGQLWKEYADSAKKFQEQNSIEKAIENYSKAVTYLSNNSSALVRVRNKIMNAPVRVPTHRNI